MGCSTCGKGVLIGGGGKQRVSAPKPTYAAKMGSSRPSGASSKFGSPKVTTRFSGRK